MNTTNHQYTRPTMKALSDTRRVPIRSRRGSALFLVTVTLVLMAIMGTTYIQMARMDRIATRRYSNGDIDAVAEAQLRQIKSVLYSDLFDSEGNMFNARDTIDGGGDEPYDYPWTNRYFNDTIILRDGSTVTVKGGINDDRWLASTMPDFDTNPTVSGSEPGKPRWPHITNLNGLYLRIPKEGGAAGSGRYPIEDVVDFTGSIYNTDTSGVHSEGGGVTLSLKITGDTTESMDKPIGKWEPHGVDCDGDDIPDSRWTYAPIRRIGDISYVSAVRIIDNSSLVNLNVALSQVNSGGSFDPSISGTNAPRWWYPSELDLGRFIQKMAAFAGTSYNADLSRILRHRLDASSSITVLPTLWGGAKYQREHFWLNGPSLYDNYDSFAGYNRLGIKDELELRFRNGLNNPETTPDIEDSLIGMPLVTRTSVLDEGTYKNFTDTLPGTDPFPESDASEIQDYFTKEPRHQMTTISGAAIYAPPLTTWGSKSIELKKDINVMIDPDGVGTLLAKPSQIAAVISEVYNADWVPGPGVTEDQPLSEFDHYKTDNPYPSDPAAPDDHSDWTVREWADQFATCIVDYADSDNRLTGIDRSGTTVINTSGDEVPGEVIYGLESLPFITEVYVQAQYTTVGGPSGTEITWNLKNNRGYVIEIRNPFRTTIPLESVHLYVEGIQWGTSLANLITTSDATAKTTLDYNEVLFLYRNSHNGTVTDTDDDITTMWPAIPPDGSASGEDALKYTPIAIDEDWPDDGPERDIKIELRAEDPTGTVFTWPYDKAPSRSLPDSYKEVVTEDESGVLDSYLQIARIGNGNRINAMLIRESEFEEDENRPLFTGTDLIGDRDDNIGALGLANKISDGGAPNIIPTSALDSNQILFSGRGQLTHVGELAHIAILGPREDMTVAEAWHAGSGAVPNDVQDFMMVFHTDDLMIIDKTAEPIETGGVTDSSFPNDESNNQGVPHSVALLDWFTTMSPAEDGEDNDNDGLADENSEDHPLDEIFVPGTINLNTVPATLLEQILPIPHDSMRQHVVDAIVQYRDNHLKVLDGKGASRGLITSPYKNESQSRGGVGSSAPIDIKNYRGNPGIAMIGELMQIVHRGSASELDTLDLLAKNSTEFGSDPDNRTVNGVVIDFDNPDATTADGIENDREEQAMVAKWLMQTCTTRSDIFTAYVLIHGYPSTDFRLGPVESARYIAVFDRSRVSSSADSVRVLGVYRLK